MEDKRESYDVDKAIIVDQNFQEYKRLIYETSGLIEKFWFDIKRQDYDMTQIILLGKKIVEEFLEVKKLYESVIEEQPDFREIVVINIAFNLNVLNFEIEALQLQSYLKNLDQKLKINKLNSYDLHHWKASSGIIIISQKPNLRNKILYINKNALELVKYHQKDVIKKDISMLMPSFIGTIHHQLIENYICSDINYQDADLRRVWIKTIDNHIIPVKIQVKTCISETRGMLMAAFLEPIQQIKKKTMSLNTSDAYFLLTDEEGFIISTSENFVKNFMGMNYFDHDIKINIDEMFQDLYKYSDKDIKRGVKTKLNLDFLHQGHGQGIFFNNDFNDTRNDLLQREITLVQVKYKLLNKVYFREIIFTLDNNQKVNLKNLGLGIDLAGKGDSIQMQNELYDAELIPGDQGSYSSASSASSSLRSNELLQTKQIIDFQSVPQSIQNVRRAIIIFFLTIVATSFAVLAVSIISNDQFKQDQESVRNSIYLIGQLANIRIAFRMLTQSPYLPKDVQAYTYDQLQQMMNKYYFSVKYYHQSMIKDEYDSGSQLVYYMRENALQLAELQSDGTITYYNTTFTIGIQQYLTKLEQFMEMNENNFKKIMPHYNFQSNGKANQTTNEKSAWFIIQNGNTQIRNFCLQIETLYIEEGKGKKTGYDTTVLIISVSCIAITIIISLIFIPVTFGLDNEEKEIVSYWMMIREKAIVEILTQITQFNQFMANDSVESNKVDIEQTIQAPSLQVEKEDAQQDNSLQQRKLILPQDSTYFKDYLNPKRLKNPKSFENITSQSSNIFKQFDDDEDEKSRSFNINSKKQNDNATKPSAYNVEGYQGFNSQKILKEKTKLGNVNHQTSGLSESKSNNINENYSIVSQGFSTIQEIDQQYYTNANDKKQNGGKSSNNSILSIRDNQQQKHVLFETNNNIQHYNTQNGYTHSQMGIMMSFGTQYNNHFHTNQNNLDQSYLNQSVDNLMQQTQSIKIEEQQRQLNSIFLREKLKKSILIMGFSVIIIGFYIASYFICGSLFTESSESFDYQKVVSRRGPCLSATYNILIETFAQNQSQFMGPQLSSLEQYIRNDCAGFEKIYQSYIKQPPPQLESVRNVLQYIEEYGACQYAFPDPVTYKQCQEKMNGLLGKGLRSTISSANYFALSQLLAFEGTNPRSRTEQFLYALESNPTQQQYLRLLLDFIIPITDNERVRIDDAVSEYLGQKINQYIIIFSVFMVFLLISLVVALKFVIRILKKVVFRSRVLIKIIPTKELKRINNIIKNQKKN